MTDYNFETLNDKEFEELVNDLLSNEFGTLVERFKAGKDQGVDGRFFRPDGKEVIIQSKHYLKSGYKPLLDYCKKVEADKVKKLKPVRYIFACSTELNRKENKALSDVFYPYLHERDVYSKQKINDLLKKFPNVEKNHYKLWLSSTNVLETLLHSDIDFDTESELDAIRRALSKYVKTSLHNKAQDKLKWGSCLVILGGPGVGKTTLARMLCHEYMSSDDKYELVFIESDLKDANKKFKKDRNQIFYFDDFLGSNCLDVIENNSDSRISKFMEKISHYGNKKLILTSRVSIFNQGMSCSEKLGRTELNHNKFILDVNEISNLDKAKILYNHIYFARRPDHQYYDHISNIIENKKYHEIINHRNYSPRIIEFILNPTSLNKINAESYWKYIMSSLDNPKHVWEYQIEKQINDFEKEILWFIALSGRIESEILRGLVCDFCNLDNDVYKYQDSIKRLDGALINRTKKNSRFKTYVTLHNPSILDYVIPTLMSNNVDYLARIIVKLGKYFRSSVIPRKENKSDTGVRLWSSVIDLIDNEELTPSSYNLALEALERLTYRKPPLYRSHGEKYHNTVQRFKNNLYVKKHSNAFNSLVQYCNENYNLIFAEKNALNVLDKMHVISRGIPSHNDIHWAHIFNAVFDEYHTHDELIEVSEILTSLTDIDDYEEIEEAFSDCVSDYWHLEIDNKVEEEFDESMLLDSHHYIYEEGMSVSDIDDDECFEVVEEVITEIIDDVLNDYSVSIIITTDLISNIDIDDYTQKAIGELRTKIEESHEPVKKAPTFKSRVKKAKVTNPVSELEAIDDLFY